MLYGQIIRWTDRNGDVTQVIVNGRKTAKEALKDAVAEAKHSGWHPPKWYEYWRKLDTKVDLSELE